MIVISHGLEIDESELTFSAVRSGGPGGQNVNKVNSKVVVAFDVANSPSLSPEQRQLILSRLAHRLTEDGRLIVTASEDRSQFRNRLAAVERFSALLRSALAPRRQRRPTAPNRASRQRRLTDKKKHSQTKQSRRSERDP